MGKTSAGETAVSFLSRKFTCFLNLRKHRVQLIFCMCMQDDMQKEKEEMFHRLSDLYLEETAEVYACGIYGDERHPAAGAGQ